MMTLQAPQTPLNLRFGTWYRPRVTGGPFEAYMCVEPSPNLFHVVASRLDGRGQNVVLVAHSAMEAFRQFALCLRMDAA